MIPSPATTSIWATHEVLGRQFEAFDQLAAISEPVMAFERISARAAPQLKAFDAIQASAAPTVKAFDAIQASAAPTVKAFDAIQTAAAPHAKVAEQTAASVAPFNASASLASFNASFKVSESLAALTAPSIIARGNFRPLDGSYVGISQLVESASATAIETLFSSRERIDASVAAMDLLGSARVGRSVSDWMRLHEVGHGLVPSREVLRVTSVAAAVVETYNDASEADRERVRLEATAEPDVHALLVTLLLSVRQQNGTIDKLPSKLDQLDKPTPTDWVMRFLAVYGALMATIQYHGFSRVWDELARLWLLVHTIPH